MPKFFISDENIINENKINVTGTDVKHIKNVLRLKKGDKITLCDGKNLEYDVIIEEFYDDYIVTVIKEKYKSKAESGIDIVLFQSIPKSDKMETIIQKSVELGINKIVPIITSRTIVHLKTEKDILKKVKRWQKIAIEAAKQSGRGVIPKIEKPLHYKEAILIIKNFNFKFILYEKERNMFLKEYFKDVNLKNIDEGNKIAFIVGPEGGFDEDEIKFAVENGIESVSLGYRILRTETVALMIVSIIIYEIGDV
jgi:16S rRNA (uracil1498-N3)-methyltransferase